MESDLIVTLAAATHFAVIAAVKSVATTAAMPSATGVAGMCPLRVHDVTLLIEHRPALDAVIECTNPAALYTQNPR